MKACPLLLVYAALVVQRLVVLLLMSRARSAQALQVVLCVECGHASRAGSHDGLLVVGVGTVACGEHALYAGLCRAGLRYDVALPV